MSLPPSFGFALCERAIDPVALTAAMADPRAGAFLAFEGWVRNEHQGRAVTGLEYQAYVELAQTEGERILAQARTRFDVRDVRCVHRIGALTIAERAVWVGACAGHREAAFAACRYVIDEVKARVPIWKREHYRDGPSAWLHPLA